MFCEFALSDVDYKIKWILIIAKILIHTNLLGQLNVLQNHVKQILEVYAMSKNKICFNK